MADVQVKPVSEPLPVVPQRDDLVARLDELLEQYLHTLDAYQKAQQQLTKHLSSGYMSLAQANFANNAHTRYGRDYYDERMQASRKVVISEDEGKVAFAVETVAAKAPTAVPETEKSSPSKDDSSETQDTETDTPQNSDSPGSEDEKKESEKKTSPRDPIRWFGVLVPPALRSAQTSFVSAVEGPVGELSTLLKELRLQEIEIGRVRKQIKKL